MRTLKVELKDTLFEKVIAFFNMLPKTDFKLFVDDKSPSGTPKKLNSLSIKTKGYKFNREEANER
ncbi:hypothetical protein [Sulfurimonas sp.]|jgi:hypothetical protein|uniref:hypothetical protein n=1 Tax=Sulfurimonas sp. TaxID=2022749 RepID=UPI002A3669F2|nr:hypothetical protein [Sulfurimonas sp.]MDY0122949.1 hypothetical protein [Sulfurimonas sp.]